MSAFRWLTSEARTFSSYSVDYSDGYQSLDNSVHLVDGEGGPNSIPRNEEEHIQMVIHFHAMITHGRTMVADVVRVLEKFPFLVNDEQYLDERKSGQSRVRGVSPLRNALLYKKYDIAEALVEMGANLNLLVDHAGSQMTLLSYCCAHGQIKLVRAILERNQRNAEIMKKKGNVAGGRGDRISMLRKAATRAAVETLNSGIAGNLGRDDRDGIDVNEKDRNGNFALLWACLFGHHNVAKVLLEHQKEVDKALAPPVFVSMPQQTPPTSSSVQKSDVGSPAGMDLSRSSSQASLQGNAAGAGAGSSSTRQDKHLVDVHARNNFGWNALTCCCHTGDYELAMDLIALGVDHSTKDQLGRSPLYICCQQGHRDVALALIVLGADLSVRCTKEQGHLGLLDVAISNGHSEIAMLLMERGCPVDIDGEPSGRSPLLLAAGCGLVNVAEEIIRRVGSSSSSTGKTAFKLSKGNPPAEEALAANPVVHAAVNRPDVRGTTPLLAAVGSASVSMVSLLLKYGAILTTRKYDQESALHIACRRSIGAGPQAAFILEELGRRLLKKRDLGAAPSPPRGTGEVEGGLEVTSLFDFASMRNEKGQTALHIAALNPVCGAEAVRAICAALGASGGSVQALLDGVDNRGDTPLHCACRDTTGAPALALVESGCDVDCVDSTGRTAPQLLLMQSQVRDARVAASSAQLYVTLVQAFVATLASADESVRTARAYLHAADELQLQQGEESGASPSLTPRLLLRKPSSFVESSSYRATPSRSNSYASSLGSSGSLGGAGQSNDPWDLEKGATTSTSLI